MFKSLKECLQQATDSNGVIHANRVGQNAPFDASNQMTDNGNMPRMEMDLNVYFSGSVPAATYEGMKHLPGFHSFNDDAAELERGLAGNLQVKATVWVMQNRMREFTEQVRNMPGFIGVELSPYCEPAEFEQFERYCTPSLNAL